MGTTTYNAATKTACFVPAAPLIAGAKYTVRAQGENFRAGHGPCLTDQDSAVFWTAAPTVQLRVTADADAHADAATALAFKAAKDPVADLRQAAKAALGLADAGEVNEVSIVAPGQLVQLKEAIDVLQLKDGDVVFASVEGDPRFAQVDIDVDLSGTRITLAAVAHTSLEVFKLKLQHHDSRFSAVCTQLLCEGKRVSQRQWAQLLKSGWRGPVQVETVPWGEAMQRHVRDTKLHNYECTKKIGGKVLGAAAGVGYTQHGVCSFVYSAHLHSGCLSGISTSKLSIRRPSSSSCRPFRMIYSR